MIVIFRLGPIRRDATQRSAANGHSMKLLSYALVALGLVALSYWACVTIGGRLFQIRETRGLDSRRSTAMRAVPASTTLASTHLRTAPITGAPFGKIIIPRLGLAEVILEGASEPQLRRGPGRILGTAFPGDRGNVGLAGHRDTFFRALRFIRKDDAISLVTENQQFRYRVVSTEIVNPSETRVLYPTGKESLTLVTCYPFNYIGAAPQRFIVHAECSSCDSNEH
jgi:sortase A